MRKELHEENRLAWNAATVAHNSHKVDQARFLREGGTTLFPEEVELLGDLSGTSLVHLQCNAGQDSLSLVRLGATVTGVDISDEAIGFARRLSAESGIPATFVRADVYDWLAEAAEGPERYDVVFSSYGAITWLSDIRAWGRGIGAILKPGGRFVLVEFHPITGMFGWGWSWKYPIGIKLRRDGVTTGTRSGMVRVCCSPACPRRSPRVQSATGRPRPAAG
ncbi:MAG TPA: methyltransferase domain-containing protein, partial [Thermomicrobiales bacterium]